MKSIAGALAASLAAAFLMAGCSLMGSAVPSLPAAPTPGQPTPAPTIDLKVLAQEYLTVAGDSNKAHKELEKSCGGSLTLSQQKICFRREAEIERTLLKAYTELKVPPELEPEFAALRKAVAAYEVVLRQGAAVKTTAQLRAFLPKIDGAARAVTAAANKVRAKLGLPLV
jgi:hypothetical protein